MSETWPTPGPWEYQIRPDGSIYLHLGGADFTELSVTEKQARLIAAAPDLLEACQEFVRKCDKGMARSIRSYKQMSAAIAKATGETRP